jgi:ABC-type branched-subunit amino acid transport system ATPase component
MALIADAMVNRLECSGVTVRFGGLVALSDVDLAVPPATIVGLVGPNGAGKSTLFGVLSGLLAPSRGNVFLHGESVSDLRPQARAARGLARTFQHPQLFSGLTVRQHLSLAFRVRNAKNRVWSDMFTMGSVRPEDPDETAMVDELIDLLGLQPMADQRALGLPLGSARLVEVGRALATSPSVLLLDEPSSGLDSSETDQFERTLRRVADERGISVLLVEHDVELVMRLCTTIYVLDFGEVIAVGPPGQVRADPAVRAAYLGEEIIPDGHDVHDVGAGRDARNARDARDARDVGAPAAVVALPGAATPNGAAGPAREGVGAQDRAGTLVVDDLSVRYGDAMALSGVSFAVDAGRVLAVLGSNGAGKSSLARALSGLVRPSGGSVRFGGEEIKDWPAARIRTAGLVHLPEGRGVFRGLTVLENLRMAAGSHVGRRSRKEAVERALDTFPALGERRRQAAGALSGGEQQMLSLARALITEAKLIIADEMSLGLAPLMVDRIFEGLARARASGISVIMIEQYVHRALDFADDCLVLQRGETAWHGPSFAAGNEVLRHYLGEAMTAAS